LKQNVSSCQFFVCISKVNSILSAVYKSASSNATLLTDQKINLQKTEKVDS